MVSFFFFFPLRRNTFGIRRYANLDAAPSSQLIIVILRRAEKRRYLNIRGDFSFLIFCFFSTISSARSVSAALLISFSPDRRAVFFPFFSYATDVLVKNPHRRDTMLYLYTRTLITLILALHISRTAAFRFHYRIPTAKLLAF